MNILKKTMHLRPFSSGILRNVAYKSALSLETLYPNSSLKLTTVSKPPSIDKEFNGVIPINALEITYSRSSGPGGQNVNKVNTKVDVRFKINEAKWLSEEIRKRLEEKMKDKLTKEGYLVFKSDLTRSQQLNLADCLQKIRSCIRNSLVKEEAPCEETQEKIRRRLERAAKERLAVKRERSIIKESRRAPNVNI